MVVLVELGECFQHIEQYKLALSHYEQAIEASDETDAEIYSQGPLSGRRAGNGNAGIRSG